MVARPRDRHVEQPQRLATLLLGIIGEWVLGSLADAIRDPGHWTEWFDEGLVFGGARAMLSTLAGACVIAPVTEELVTLIEARLAAG